MKKIKEEFAQKSAEKILKQYTQIEFWNIEEDENYKKLINKVVNTCFEEENLTNTNLYLNIILTNPQTIKETNSKYRNIDKETDVLSFPMFEKAEIEEIIKKSKQSKKDNTEPTEDVLGDIMVSIPKVIEQAKEYEHSIERELAYMIVHGFYHVMGYDHIEEKDKKVMRPKEENILNKLNITREIQQ